MGLKSIILLTLFAGGCFFYAASEKVAYYDNAYDQNIASVGKIDLKKNIQAKIAISQKVQEKENLREIPKMELMEKNESKEIEEKIYAIVGDAPIKEMVPFIAKQDRTVAALVVGIAKKESNWGSASPSLEGKDCFNYWGYKGAGSRGTAMGYGCFATPEEGAKVIGERIAELVKKDLSTPSKMIVWKCGSTCAGHDPVAVQKWINDVNLYFGKIIAFAG